LVVVYFQDPRTGLQALLEGSYLTDVRTGALTGVACQILADPETHRLGLIGAGRQAGTQLDAVLATLPVQAVRVWSRRPAALVEFVTAATRRHSGVRIEAATNAEAAVSDAQVVVCATTSGEPVFEDRWLADGALVCGIGSRTPEAAELDPRTVERAEMVVVDSRRGALAGAGDLHGPIAAGTLAAERVVELGDLILGRVPGRVPGRAADGGPGARGITVFKSVGFAALDVAAARLVVERALAEGIGLEVELG
jgi:ornithine cyclodeaminase